MSDVNLSAPCYSFTKKIKYTYGLSKYIHVNDLINEDSVYTLTINVCNNLIATSLRSILPTTKIFGSLTMNIIIFNEFGHVVPVSEIEYTPQTLALNFCHALNSNPLFIGTVTSFPDFPPIIVDSIGTLVVVIKPVVVQFFDDNIIDLCGNFNEVASKVFSDISNLSYYPNIKISFSTYDKNSPLQKDIYCPKCCIC